MEKINTDYNDKLEIFRLNVSGCGQTLTYSSFKVIMHLGFSAEIFKFHIFSPLIIFLKNYDLVKKYEIQNQ